MAILSLVTVFALTGAGAASAATENCPSGWACGYNLVNYSTANDDYYFSQKSSYGWSHVGFANKVSSAAANGGKCNTTYFYANYNVLNAEYGGLYFYLNSKDRVGSNYRDPDLSNGAGRLSSGVSMTSNINNDIEYHEFRNCVA